MGLPWIWTENEGSRYLGRIFHRVICRFPQAQYKSRNHDWGEAKERTVSVDAVGLRELNTYGLIPLKGHQKSSEV